MDCVEVCPVDAFYEGENMLVINPDECISCGACEPERPIGAILPDSEPVSWRWIQINAKCSVQWPNINRKRLPPEDANQYRNVSSEATEIYLWGA
jgi:ferredoxin